MELKMCNDLKYPQGFNGLEWDSEIQKPPKRENISFYLKQNLPDQKFRKIRTLFQKFNDPNKYSTGFQQDINISNKQSSEKKEKITNLFSKFNTTEIPDRTYFEIFLNRQYSQKRRRENFNKQKNNSISENITLKQEISLGQQYQYQHQNLQSYNIQQQRKQIKRKNRNKTVFEFQNKQLNQISEAKKVVLDELGYMKIFADKNSNMKLDCIDQLTLYNKLQSILTTQNPTESIHTPQNYQNYENQHQLEQRKQLKTANYLPTSTKNRKQNINISNNTSFFRENEILPPTTTSFKKRINKTVDLHTKLNLNGQGEESIQVINEYSMMSPQNQTNNLNQNDNNDEFSYKDKLIMQRQKDKINSNEHQKQMNHMVEQLYHEIQVKKQKTLEEKLIKRRKADPQQIKIFAKNHLQYEQISKIKQRRKALCDKFFNRQLGLPFDDPFENSKKNILKKSTNHSTIQAN